MATPALRALFHHESVEKMLVVGRRAPLQVLSGSPFAVHTLEFKPCSKTPGIPGRRRLVAHLRRQKLDAIVLFPNSFSSAMIAFLARIPRRIGYNRDGRGWLLTERVPMVGQMTKLRDTGLAPIPAQGIEKSVLWNEQPLVDYYLNLARTFGCSTTDRRMQIGFQAEDEIQANQFLEQLGLSPDRPFVVLNNGSATADARLWPEDYFSIVARELAELGIQVVIHAGPGDRLQANKIASASAHRLVQSMGRFEQLPMSLSRGLLKLAELVVTTDSGVRHVAAALGQRVVVLYGPTSVVLTRTYNTKETALSVGLPCQPCLQSTCALKHNRCMSDIKPKRVLQVVQTLLRESKSLAA